MTDNSNKDIISVTDAWLDILLFFFSFAEVHDDIKVSFFSRMTKQLEVYLSLQFCYGGIVGAVVPGGR